MSDSTGDDDLVMTLVARLAQSGTVATPEQARALAVRVSGSVAAYLADLEHTSISLEGYTPLEPDPDKVPHKFKQRLV